MASAVMDIPASHVPRMLYLKYKHTNRRNKQGLLKFRAS
jgi:hypothetical protein